MQKAEQRWLDWPAIILLIVAMWLVGLRIQVTNWTEDLSLIQYSILLATIIGMSLGYSVFDRRPLVAMALAYSILVVTWLFSLLMPANLLWAEKILGLYESIRISIGEFFRNEPVRGVDLFMIFMIFSFWWIGLFAGYQLTRYGKPWLPIGILFGTFLIVDYFPPFVQSRHIISALVVLILLLLLGRLYFLHAHEMWKSKRAMVDYGTGLDFTRYVFITALILVIFAWGVPSVAQFISATEGPKQKFVDFWGPLQDRLSNVVTDLRGPTTVSSDFFGKNLPLGTQISEDETPVFTVEVSSPRARGFRYYWRGYSYDQYSDGVWSSTIDQYETIDPAEWPIALPEWNARQKVDVYLQWSFNRSRLIYIPGSPLQVSRPVQWVVDETGTGFDGIALFGESSLYSYETVEAQVWVSVPTALQLQNAGEEYPEWVTAKYLQLPGDLPPSLGDLALQITEGLENPLDRTLAITQYLRDNIEYAGEVEPPDGQEPLEWFLFDAKEGFCNYYASAEVILLRTLGIPARLVVGFAEGDRLEESNQFEVKLKHSHAWPEVFFPGIGWVEFEPTVIRTPPTLAYEDLSQIEADPSLMFGMGEKALFLLQQERFESRLDAGTSFEPTYLPRSYYPFREWAFFAATLIGILLIFWIQRFQRSEIFDRRIPVLIENILKKRGFKTPSWLAFLSMRASLSPIARWFSEIPWMLRFMGEKTNPGQTPAEQIEVLNRILPSAKNSAQVLLQEFQTVTFSPRPGNTEMARLAHSRLWGQVLVASIKRILQQ